MKIEEGEALTRKGAISPRDMEISAHTSHDSIMSGPKCLAYLPQDLTG